MSDTLKHGVRVLAIAGGIIRTHSALMVGVIYRDGTLEGVLSDKITVDGTDSTATILNMLKRSKFRQQIRIIALNGVALAGFNIVDVKLLEKELKLKGIIITRKKPDRRAFEDALKKSCKANKIKPSSKLEIFRKLSDRKFVKHDEMYVQAENKSLVKAHTAMCFEALRLAHIIASGISEGESRGRV